jgi:predicted Zn-dependent protease
MLIIKEGRFIGYFEDADTAMRYGTENYKECSPHVEPLWVLGEDKS